jgi:cyclopropane fatty-acyl-phospholipid synthase-like methyltransferase
MNVPQSHLIVNQSIDRATFEHFYSGAAPWDIGKPQDAFAAILGRLTSPVLDAGCGTGEHALFFAAKGFRVTGIDFVEEAIRRAKRKATERGLPVEFLVKDALALTNWTARFASAIDCGLFHVFSDADRKRYVEGLAHVLQHGGRLFLMCFSDSEPGTDGPRRVSRQELHDAFADGWQVESVQPAQCEVNPESTVLTFPDSAPKVWFAVIRRNG